MWKYVVKAVRGSAHHMNGLPCQDSSSALLVGDTLICVISDGAGSARYADEGSEIVVEEATAYFQRLLADHPHPIEILRELDISDGNALIQQMQSRIQNAALSREAQMSDFAATMLVAIVHEERACFYQIGDGLWCVSRNRLLAAATWPEQGEFAGQTAFVTSKSCLNVLQFSAVEGSVDYIVGMSDGLERLAVDFKTSSPHGGFCNPLIKRLLATDDLQQFGSDLESWLSSDIVCDRTDDDKTIALIAHVCV